MTTRLAPLAAGQVACPEAGLVDLERCLTCPQLLRILTGDDAADACVECRPRQAALSATWDGYTTLAGHLPG